VEVLEAETLFTTARAPAPAPAPTTHPPPPLPPPPPPPPLPQLYAVSGGGGGGGGLDDANELDVAVFRFTLGIPGFDDRLIPRFVGGAAAALLAVNHVVAAQPVPDAQVCGCGCGCVRVRVVWV